MNQPTPGYLASEILDTYTGKVLARMGASDSAVADSLLEAMAEAPRYFLSESASQLVTRTELEGSIFEDFRLPYESLLLEIDVGESTPEERARQAAAGEIDCRYRVVLAFEAQTGGSTAFYFVVWAKVRDPKSGLSHWALSPVTVGLSRERLLTIDRWTTKLDKPDGRGYGGFALPLDVLREITAKTPLPGYLDALLRAIPPEQRTEALDRLALDAAADVITALKFFAVLSAHGVGVEVIETPTHVNRKRRKHKKLPPIPAYRTLSLRGTGGEERGTGEPGAGGVARRAHWRRGHLRWQAYGPGRSSRRRVWVRPVIVGRAGGVPAVPAVRVVG